MKDRQHLELSGFKGIAGSQRAFLQTRFKPANSLPGTAMRKGIRINIALSLLL